MRISRLVFLCTLAVLGLSTPASAGGRGGHHPRPVVTPPLLHGGSAARPVPVRPQHHGLDHRPRRGWSGHYGNGPVGLPVYGWPAVRWQQPAAASRATRGEEHPHFGAVIVAPGAGLHRESTVMRSRPQRRVPGYYDRPRPMAKIIHLERKAQR